MSASGDEFANKVSFAISLMFVCSCVVVKGKEERRLSSRTYKGEHVGVGSGCSLKGEGRGALVGWPTPWWVVAPFVGIPLGEAGRPVSARKVGKTVFPASPSP